MHHKRGRHKAARSGCLMCKPNKRGAGMENALCHAGFGKIRDERHAQGDLREFKSGGMKPVGQPES